MPIKDKNRKIVTLDFWNKNGDVSNSFKTLFANIRFASVDNEIKSIVVVGSGISEGKTMVSLNLANAIASAGYKTLIVEGDMRKNSLSKLLDIKPKYGIFSILSGVCTPKEACATTNIENLYFLDSENNIPSPPDVLSTSRFAALVDNLQETFEYVIFDTPPLSSFVDGAILANLVDGTIIAVRQGKAKRTKINEIIQQLKKANANILGTVLTFSTEASEKDYYYAYYNKDHQRVNKEDFKPREEVNDQVAQSNLDSWLDESSTGRAKKRRDMIANPQKINNDTDIVNNQLSDAETQNYENNDSFDNKQNNNNVYQSKHSI